jgi:hypothetical protein
MQRATWRATSREPRRICRKRQEKSAAIYRNLRMDRVGNVEAPSEISRGGFVFMAELMSCPERYTLDSSSADPYPLQSPGPDQCWFPLDTAGYPGASSGGLRPRRGPGRLAGRSLAAGGICLGIGPKGEFLSPSLTHVLIIQRGKTNDAFEIQYGNW